MANLYNGVDIYILPTMQLVKMYNHGSVDTVLYQVVFADKDWVIFGSEDTHVYMSSPAGYYNKSWITAKVSLS